MFFYTSFQKGLITFYSLGQEFCLFFCLTRFKWSSGQWWIRRQSQRWLSFWCALISLWSGWAGPSRPHCTGDRPNGLCWGSLQSFHFSCSLEMNTSEIGHSAYFYFSEVTKLWILNDSCWAARCGNPIRTKTQTYLANGKHGADTALSTEECTPQNRRCGHRRDTTCFNKINIFCMNMSK